MNANQGKAFITQAKKQACASFRGGKIYILTTAIA